METCRDIEKFTETPERKDQQFYGVPDIEYIEELVLYNIDFLEPPSTNPKVFDSAIEYLDYQIYMNEYDKTLLLHCCPIIDKVTGKRDKTFSKVIHTKADLLDIKLIKKP